MKGVVLAAATSVGVGVTYTDIAPLIPLLKNDFGLNDVLTGLLTSCLFLAAGVTMFATGGLTERRGPHQMIVASLAFGCTGSFAFALAPSYAFLLGAKAVAGIGAGLSMVSGLRYVNALYRDGRSHFGVGIYGAGYALGSALALVAMPVLAQPATWRGAFLASGAFIAAVLVMWLFAPRVASSGVSASVLAALRSPNSWWCFVQHAAGIGLAISAGTWIAVYIVRTFELSLVLSGALGSLLLVMGIFMRPLGGYVVSRHLLSTIATMRLAQALVLGGLALLAVAPSLATALAGMLLVGIGSTGAYAAVLNTAASSLPRAPSSAMALAAWGGVLGVVGGAPAVGFAIERGGFSIGWLVLAAVSAVALAGTFFMAGEEQLASSR